MTRNETFNGLREFLITGKYFELLSTVNPVDVVAYADDGRVLCRELQVSAGFFIDRQDKEEFVRLEVTTGGNEAVKIMWTDGLSGNRSTGIQILDNAARLLGVVYGSLGQIAQQIVGGVNVLPVSERGFAYGATYKSTASLVANASDTVFTPPSNPNGAIVWGAEAMSGNAGGFAACAWAAHTAAPNSVVVGDVLAMNDAGATNAAPFVASFSCIRRPVFVPSGKGLYFTTAITETGQSRAARYTLL